MPDERDNRRDIIPPKHVRAQTAKPVAPPRAHATTFRTADDDFAPEHVDEDITGAHHTDEELHKLRNSRTPNERFDILERKADASTSVIAEFKGKLDALLTLAGAADAERTRRADADAKERESKRKMIVPIITAIGMAIAGIVAAYYAGGH